jgi:hypothetical protein
MAPKGKQKGAESDDTEEEPNEKGKQIIEVGKRAALVAGKAFALALVNEAAKKIAQMR